MSGAFDSQPYKALRGPSSAFTVKQLPFVTVMSRPSTASSAQNVQPQTQPQPRPASRPQSCMSQVGAAAGEPFSPKWAADKIDRSKGKGHVPVNGSAAFRATAPQGRPGAAAPSVESAIRNISQENHALSLEVQSLLSMISREKELKMDADAQLKQLERKFRELEGTIKRVESENMEGSKVWRLNAQKPLNFGPLAPSSVMDPFAEEQRIVREKQQRLAERDRKRREQLEQTTATDSKSAATMMMHP
jgi:hypothetical protein